MATWKIEADGIEEITYWVKDNDTLITRQWYRYGTWTITTDDDIPPAIECDTNVNSVGGISLEELGDIKGSIEYECTCDLSKNEDGGLNTDELNQPEDFGWDLPEVELWIRSTPDISRLDVVDEDEEENEINNSEDKVNSDKKTIRVVLPAGYKPSEKHEQYMSLYQLEYFRQMLLAEQKNLLEASQGVDMEAFDESTPDGKTIARVRKLLYKIEKILKTIDDGTYGYCVDTGEEIGIKRLLERPMAERTIEAQERWEEKRKNM